MLSLMLLFTILFGGWRRGVKRSFIFTLQVLQISGKIKEPVQVNRVMRANFRRASPTQTRRTANVEAQKLPTTGCWASSFPCFVG